MIKKILTLEEINIIHTQLTSFIFDRITKFYTPILRKMLAEVFSKNGIRRINNFKMFKGIRWVYSKNDIEYEK